MLQMWIGWYLMSSESLEKRVQSVQFWLQKPGLDKESLFCCKGNSTRGGYYHTSLAEGDPKYIRYVQEQETSKCAPSRGRSKEKRLRNPLPERSYDYLSHNNSPQAKANYYHKSQLVNRNIERER